jgi:hypothetical protein
MRHRALALAVASIALGAASEQARAWTDCPGSYTKYSYYKPSPLPTADTRCDYDSAGHCLNIDLVGYLFKPPPPPPGQIGQIAGFPLLVFNHGSESDPGPKCAEGEYFSQKGFVVFVPVRRGHTGSTGMTFAEYTSGLPNVPSTHECSTPNQSGPCKMEYLHRQETDVENAINFVKALRVGLFGPTLVNPDRIAIMGHSFGGIVTTFSNAKNMGQKVAISIAGASQSWEGNDSASSEMIEAVTNAVAPIYFLEPMNDHSIMPTIVLSQVAGINCRLFQAALFPASEVGGSASTITIDDYKGDWDGDGKTYDPRDKAHGTFTGVRIDEWSPTVLEFINRYFAKPGKNDSLCVGTSVGND